MDDPPVVFWFDFASPYAWLASAQVEGVVARCGRRLAWRAIPLGVVFRRTGMAPLLGQPLRGDYARRDVARIARRLRLACATMTPPPGTSLAAARVFHAIALRDAGLAASFARAAFAAIFAEGRDLGTVEAAQAFAATLGVEAAEAASAALDAPARAALRAATEEAVAGGVFGAPFFTVGEEPFWGQDRLPMLEAWLRDGPW